MDISGKLCRTCLSGEKPLIDLFSYDGILPECDTKISLYSMLSSVGHVEIRQEDGLPGGICHSCLEKASIAYDFKVCCQRSDAILRKLPFILNNEFKQTPTAPTAPTASTARSEDIYKNDLLEYPSWADNSTQIENINVNAIAMDKKNILSETKYQCQHCDKSYSQKYYLQHHLMTHSENKDSNARLKTGETGDPYQCDVCGKRFHLARGLRQHLKYHRDKAHSCHLCDKKYFNIRVLREHIRCSHSSQRYNFQCPTCGKQFTAKSTLKKHIKVHTGDRDHACDKCGKKYTRAVYLREHLRKHSDEPPSRLFVCAHDNCERVYANKTSLEIHIRHRHTLERPHVCDTCGKKFGTRSGLKSHQRTHGAQDRQECSLCGRFLTNKMSLKKHMRLHTGERPYQCDVCGERFISSSIRKEHLQSKHLEPQYECLVCKKQFHLRRVLKRHMNVHSKEKLAKTIIVSDISGGISIMNIDTKQNVPEPGFEVIV